MVELIIKRTKYIQDLHELLESDFVQVFILKRIHLPLKVGDEKK